MALPWFKFSSPASFYPLGGALAVGTVIYGISATKLTSKPPVSIAPMASAGTGGLVIAGPW